MVDQIINWIVFLVVIVLIVLVLYALFRILRKSKKEKHAELERVEPQVDDLQDPEASADAENQEQKTDATSAGTDAAQNEPDDELLREEIKKAGAEAVAASYGDAHQSEISFDEKQLEPSDWGKVVKDSYQRRVGKEPKAAAMQAKPDTKSKPVADERSKDDFIVLYLMAPRSSEFDGQLILRALRRQNLKLTDKRVFEAKVSRDGTLYYVGSVAPPGTFNVEKMHQFTAPGLNFIIDLNHCPDPKTAMNQMLTAIDSIAKQLGGDILDDRRQRLNRASLSEYYARIKSEEMLRKGKASHA